jgi:hypothetical protein
LLSGKNDLPEGYSINDFLVDFDCSEDDVKDKIREGIKKCINPFGGSTVRDQFTELYQRMTDEDRDYVKKTVEEGLQVKNPNGVKEHPAQHGMT